MLICIFSTLICVKTFVLVLVSFRFCLRMPLFRIYSGAFHRPTRDKQRAGIDCVETVRNF